jgi:cytochrome P450
VDPRATALNPPARSTMTRGMAAPLPRHLRDTGDGLPRPPASSPLLTETARDAAPVLARLRERDPVHWIPGLDAWFVTRHEDVRLLFADPRVTADPRQYAGYVAPTEPGAARWLAELPFLSATPGSPSRGRRLVSAALTPRAVSRMEDRVRDVVEQFAAPLRKRRGVVDLVAEFTTPIPGTVIGRILGVPPKGEDEARFHTLSRKMVLGVNPILSDQKRRQAERAAAEICEYLLELVLARREQPREDLISDLLRVPETEAPATPEEIVRVVAGLVSAGTETIRLAATCAFRALFRHPDQLARLRADRSLLPSAVAELLRYDLGLLGLPRYVLEDFELRGRSLRKGQLVVLSFMGAHRDPRAFDAPDRLDLGRQTKNLVAFGHGLHHCIGANVARTELRLMLDAALDFLPEAARLLDDRIRWGGFGILARIKSLPVDFG